MGIPRFFTTIFVRIRYNTGLQKRHYWHTGCSARNSRLIPELTSVFLLLHDGYQRGWEYSRSRLSAVHRVSAYASSRLLCIACESLRTDEVRFPNLELI